MLKNPSFMNILELTLAREGVVLIYMFKNSLIMNIYDRICSLVGHDSLHVFVLANLMNTSTLARDAPQSQNAPQRPT
jgi:hypothetical protein